MYISQFCWEILLEKLGNDDYKKNLCKILKCGENGIKLVKTFICGQSNDTDERNKNCKWGKRGAESALCKMKMACESSAHPIHTPQNNPCPPPY